MKEVSEKKLDNSAGIVGVVFGILSLVTLLVPVIALILAVIGFVFAFIQRKKMNNSWATAGLWLSGIALLLGIAWNVYYIIGIAKFVAQNQQQIQALQGLSQQAGSIDPSAYANYGN